MAPGLNARHRTDVVDNLSHQTPFVPRATKEMAEKNIRFEETEAGKSLESDVKRLNKKLEDMEKEIQDKTKALDDLQKEMREAIAMEKENASKSQEKFLAEMTRERQTAKGEQAKMTKMLSEAQTKTDLELKKQHDISEAKMRAMMDRASAERIDMQRQSDAAQQRLYSDIQRLGNMIAQETSSRSVAEQNANSLQKRVWELEREAKRLDRENDKLLDDLIKASETEDRLRSRIRRLQ